MALTLIRKDRCNLRAIKERSSRLEDSAKKQNEYQERKLSKYLLGIEKEHEGNMTMLRQQEKELKRTERKLTRQLSRLNRQRADSAYLSLPTIALSEKALSGEEELPGQRGRKNLIRRKEASWYDDQASRDSVIIRLLNFPNKVEPDEPAEEEEQEMPLRKRMQYLLQTKTR
ncbi:hypothetical protein ACHWQZ_G011224 [Mnemiopsis leidyi]